MESGRRYVSDGACVPEQIMKTFSPCNKVKVKKEELEREAYPFLLQIPGAINLSCSR